MYNTGRGFEFEWVARKTAEEGRQRLHEDRQARFDWEKEGQKKRLARSGSTSSIDYANIPVSLVGPRSFRFSGLARFSEPKRDPGPYPTTLSSPSLIVYTQTAQA